MKGPRSIAKGAAAGLAGGLVAAFVMREFQNLWSWMNTESDNGGRNGRDKEESNKKEPATVKAAEMASNELLGRKLTGTERSYAGPVMHYGMGGFSGLVYGIASEVMPRTATGAGLPFGAAVWMTADNLVVPALGLARWPTESNVSKNAYALASHLVYGLTTEVVRDTIRRVI